MTAVAVALTNGSTVVYGQTQTNGNGWFSLKKENAGGASVSIHYIGYESQMISITPDGNDELDLGEIKLTPKNQELEEVTVTGARVIEKADKYIVIPSIQELTRATESLNLLSEIKVKMPGLTINEALQTVSIDGGGVIFQINGKQEPFSKIRTLNHQNIARIEYRNTPDIRHGDGASGIINFIMKPRQEGGSIMIQADNAVTTLRSNTIIGGSYFYKKSEWSLNYNNIWRKSTKQYSDIREQYIGRETAILRNQIGLPSSTRDFSNTLSLAYTYMHNSNTMFSAKLSWKSNDINNKNHNRMLETADGTTSGYEKHNPNKTQLNSPALDLYFRKNINESQYFELNATGIISDGDYFRGMNYIYDDKSEYIQSNITKNKSWASGIEALYSISFKNITTRYGINYKHNETENKYTENQNPTSIENLTRDDVYFYGDASGKWKNLGYSVGIGGKYFQNEGAVEKESNLRVKATATLNYKIGNHWSMNYLYMYSPEMPSLSSMNETVHTIDDISLQMGNLNIRPSEYHRNRLYVRYNTGRFYATAWGSYSRTNNPINSIWYYDDNASSPYYRKFINKVENGDYTDNINAQLDLSYQNLFDHITISASVGWDRYNIADRHEYYSLKKVYASISANAYFGNWTIFANYDIAPRYSLDGRTFCRSIRYDYVGAKFRWRNFSFGGRIVNPFTKRGFLQTLQTPSETRPVRNEFYIKDFANMAELNIVYFVNFGKSYNKARRTLQNGGIDTGVNVEY